jgi:hypothetical protein
MWFGVCQFVVKINKYQVKTSLIIACFVVAKSAIILK